MSEELARDIVRRVTEKWIKNKRQAVLQKNPEGLTSRHTDGGQMPVTQTEYHIDHAPTLDQYLKGKRP